MIDGWCSPGFERVRAAFEQNFRERGDVGAAVAATVHGEPVVDLWGGWLDARKTRPWTQDSIVNVWSVGKAVTATCLLRLVARGQVDLDAPVADYWPEFAQAGKASLPVRMLLNHQAGLPAVAKPLEPGINLTSWETMATVLAEQEPWWTPGSGFGYHVNTFGFLSGEVIRRVDGRAFDVFLREEITGPFGIDFLCGFGPEEDARVAEWLVYVPQQGEQSERPWLQRDPATLSGIDLGRVLAYSNPPRSLNLTNSRVWRQAVFPSTNGHSNARALARFFGALANGGRLDGNELLPAKLIERAIAVESDGEDLVLGRPNRFGLGFQLTIPGVRELGNGARDFGHYGNGGLVGFGDPDRGLGFSYTCNQSGRSWRDPRNIALINAVYDSLA